MYQKKVILIGVLVVFLLPALTLGLASNQKDSEYASEDGSTYIFQPAFWTGVELSYKTVKGSDVDILYVLNQVEQNFKHIRGVFLYRSDATGIFDLPSSVTNKLDPVDFVNFYMDWGMRTSVGPRITSAKILQRNGATVYSVEWTYVSIDEIPYTQIDEFIFRNTTIYHIQGLYPTSETAMRTTILKMVQSVRVR